MQRMKEKENKKIKVRKFRLEDEEDKIEGKVYCYVRGIETCRKKGKKIGGK